MRGDQMGSYAKQYSKRHMISIWTLFIISKEIIIIKLQFSNNAGPT